MSTRSGDPKADRARARELLLRERITLLDDEQLRAIGNVVVQWSQLESAALEAFVLFLKLEENVGRQIAAQIGRVDTLLKIVDTHADLDAAKMDEFREIRDAIASLGLEKRRHAVVHRSWWRLVDDPGGRMEGRSETRRNFTDPELKTPTEINKLAFEISEQMYNLRLLVDSVRE